MRIELSDLDRLEGIAEALGRLFWCLIVVAFFAAILGSAGTGFLVLILGGASFCARVGCEDFIRSRRGEEDRPAKGDDKPAKRRAPRAKAQAEPEFTVYRSPRRRPRRTRSAV
jgi:hypothetical protein